MNVGAGLGDGAAANGGVGDAASGGVSDAANGGVGDAERLDTTRMLLSAGGGDVGARDAGGAGKSTSAVFRRDLLASKITRIGPAAWRMARSIAAEAASAAASGLAVWAPADAAVSSRAAAAAAAQKQFHTSTPPKHFAACGRRSARRAPWIGRAEAELMRF